VALAAIIITAPLDLEANINKIDRLHFLAKQNLLTYLFTGFEP